MTAIKTIEYWFASLNTLANTTLTNLGTIAVQMPEAGKVFRSCFVEVTVHCAETAAANITTKTLNFRLGAAAYTSVPWTQTITNSGENISFMMTGDFTAHFTTNWTGGSMTAGCQVLATQAATGFTNVTARLVITYEYDETSVTQMKTVRIPLNSTQAALALAKPASMDTIPLLNTFLPEASAVIRDCVIVIEGNQHSAAVATDITLSMEIDTLGVNTSAIYERALATNSYFRYAWRPTFSYAATHTFHLWANVAACNCPVVTMVITYDFNATTTTRVLNSIMLPMDWAAPIGLSTTEYSHAERSVWVEEPGTITVVKSALVLTYHTTGAVGALNHRVNPSATWVASTVNLSACAGSILQMMDASAITLARGKNTIGADFRSTSTTILATNVTSMWYLNYTSDKATLGVHAHNQTTLQKVLTTTNQTAAVQLLSGDVIVYDGAVATFRTGIGVDAMFIVNSTSAPAGLTINVQRRSGATHLGYDGVYSDPSSDDAELGIRYVHAQARDLFRRWTDDADSSRIPLSNARKYRVGFSASATGFCDITFVLTSHSITRSVAGSIANGPSANANAKTIKLYNNVQGLLLELPIAGGISTFDLTWFDDVNPVVVVLTDDVTGDSAFARGLAGIDTFSVDFTPGGGGGGGEFGYGSAS